MKKIRKGNDITVTWSIYDKDSGIAYDLEGRNITLYAGRSNSMHSVPFTIDGNNVIWHFAGKDQEEIGTYSLILVENEGSADMRTVDVCNAFLLVSHTCTATDSEDDENVMTEAVHLTSDIYAVVGGASIGGGIGTPIATAESVPYGQEAAVTLTTSGSDTAKVFEFHFEIPEGKQGEAGQDGKDGADGVDGKNGTNGINGKDGVDGKDGITPKLKIENGYWYVSYDEGKTWTQAGIATSGSSGGGNITIDTTLSTLSTNAVQNKVITTELNKKGTYSKPNGGIPKSDLSSEVQTSLGKADTALQEHQSLADYAKSADLAKVATSGSYNDLSDKPNIPEGATVDSVLSTTSTNAVQNKVVTAELNKKGTYSKPSAGIPKSDLAAAVQDSLGKADSALQSYTEQYKGTVTGVKINDTNKTPDANGVVDLGEISAEPSLPAYAEYTGTSTAVVVNTISGYFPATLVEGAKVTVKIEGALSTIASLNVNSTGAKNVYYDGKSLKYGSIRRYNIYDFVYDGVYWRICGVSNTNTLTFTNLTASTWVEDATYADYGYRCDIACTGVTADSFAEVVFDVAEATSGAYAPICETKANTVSIWSSSTDGITIPVIIITQ